MRVGGAAASVAASVTESWVVAVSTSGSLRTVLGSDWVSPLGTAARERVDVGVVLVTLLWVLSTANLVPVVSPPSLL